MSIAPEPREIVIVTHDGPLDQVAACIDAVVASTRDPGPTYAGGSPGAVQIMLVHNGPDAGPITALCQQWPEVRLIHTVNRGYGAAVNCGLSATRTDYVMVLNDDVQVDPGWWHPLADALDSDPGLGAVAPLILLNSTHQTSADQNNSDRALRINSMGVQLGPDGAGVDIGYGDLVETAPSQPTEIEIFTGGAVMLRRSMWETLGGFDTRYFLYYEDVDLALRGREAKWRYQLIPASRVIHAQGATTSAPTHAPLVSFLQERNRLWIVWRFGSARQICGALWLSVRRLRHPPIRIHVRALTAGLHAAPERLGARWIARAQRRTH
jgi:N-acetylglucosaminyl-diphospho-decaprenol L-rhamnosyltransferase